MVMTGIAWPGRLLKSFETLSVSSHGFTDNKEFITRTNASIKVLQLLCGSCLYTVFLFIYFVTLLLLLFSARSSQKRDLSSVGLCEVSPIFILIEAFPSALPPLKRSL